MMARRGDVRLKALESCAILGASLLFLVLTGCRPQAAGPVTAPAAVPVVTQAPPNVLHIHVVDYQHNVAPNVQLATDHQTTPIAPTDTAGNTSIYYRADRLTVFVLQPAGMAVLAPYDGEVDLRNDPEHLMIAPKGKPIIVEEASVRQSLAIEVLAMSDPQTTASWGEAVKVVAKEMDIAPADLNGALQSWADVAETPLDRSLAALCRRDFRTAAEWAGQAETSTGEDAHALAVAHLVLSHSRLASGDFNGSLQAAVNAVALQPGNQALTRALAFSLKERGEVPGAAAAFLASGCQLGTCTAVQTVSTVYAARTLESAGLKDAAVNTWRQAVQLGDFADPALAEQSRERLAALEPRSSSLHYLVYRKEPVVSWVWIPIVLVVAGRFLWLWVRTQFFGSASYKVEVERNVQFEKVEGNVPLGKIERQLMVLAQPAPSPLRQALPAALALAAVFSLGWVLSVGIGGRGFRPVAASAIAGIVQDQSGHGIPQATVRVVGYAQDAAQTAADGRFRISLPNGTRRLPLVLLQVAKEGFVPAVESTVANGTPRIVLRSQ
jgi:hypothetical protein